LEQLIRRDLDVELAVRAPAEGVDERVIEGIVVPWDQVATVRSEGEYKTPGTIYRESIARGAAAGMNPERVTLESSEHKGALVGRGITAEERPEGLHMALKVARTASGDELLELAREKVLTGMSIVFQPVTERMRADGVIERTAIDIRRVAVLERGAYPAAQVSAVRAEPSPERNKPVEYVTRDEKASRVVELEQALERQANAWPGVMPPDEQAKLDADFNERAALVRDIAAWDDRQKRLKEFASREENIEPVGLPTIKRTQSIEDIHDLAKIESTSRNREEAETLIRENALRSIELSRSAKDLNHLVDLIENYDEGTDGKGEIAKRVLATGSPVYRRAFAKYLRHGNTMAFTPEESRAAIAVVGTTTTGGYAVPYIFDPTMYHTGVWTAENPFRRACRTVEISNGNNWRTVTVGAITSAYATEALAASENAPSFGQPTYTVQRAQAFATVSIETLEDRADITSELTSVFAESKDTLEENQFAIGVGTTVYPMGMFTDTAYTNQDTATNDVTAIADLQVLEGALPLRYRANGAFFMNRSTLRQLMALDTTYRYFSGAGVQFAGQNQPNGNGGGNTGLQCLGYPVWEVPSAVSTLITDGAIIVVFCDPRSYIIVDRIGMNVEVVPTMLNGATPSFPTGQRGIYVYWRNTAKPITADAGRSLSVQ
jgi:HK97 family phage major capsid protein/HK97 family phage prohead protease